MSDIKWSKQVTQKVFYNANDVRIAVNAPRGLVEGAEDAWKDALCSAHDEEETAWIDTVEKAFLFSEGLIKYVKADKYYSLGDAYDLYSACVSPATETGEIDHDAVRSGLIHWILSIYDTSDVDLDHDAVTVTGKRVDDFLSLIGRVKRDSHYGKKSLMKTGNVEIVIKSERAFMKALCDWTVAVAQMRYTVEPHLVIR